MNNGNSGGRGFLAILRAFKYRNYRIYFAGQSISLIGTWMQNVAMSWLVFRLTGSAVLLGTVSFSSQLPTLLLAPIAGVLIDRWKRHHVIIGTQLLLMIQASILAFLTLTDMVQVWHIIVLSVFLGSISAFDMPGRQSFLIDIIEKKEDLGNAIALNSSIFNGARMIGPSIAGIVVAQFGEGICFLLNAISFLAVLAALLTMKVADNRIKKEKSLILSELKEGFAYAFGFIPIRTILIHLFLLSMMGLPAMVLLPVFTSKILHGGPEILGFLTASTGVGALIGALFLASRKNVLGLGKIILFASSVFGAGVIAFSLSRNLYLSIFFVAMTGFGFMVQMASSNTLIQTIVEEDKRGRVMSIYTTSFMGAGPLGSLMAGALPDLIGAPGTVMLGGCFILASTLFFAWRLPSVRKMLRPIYLEKGILAADNGSYQLPADK